MGEPVPLRGARAVTFGDSLTTSLPSIAVVIPAYRVADQIAEVVARVPPEVDNMLKITTEGRKAALDIRLVMPNAPRQPFSKIEAVADNIAEFYRQSQNQRAAQILFCDLGTPRPATSR